MAHTACFVCLVSTVSGHLKNALGRGSASSWHTTRQSTFLRYLCLAQISVACFANSKVLRSLPAVYWHAMSICTLLFLLKTFVFRVLRLLAQNYMAERHFVNTICSKETCWLLKCWRNDSNYICVSKFGSFRRMRAKRISTGEIWPNVCWPNVCLPKVCLPKVCWHNVCLA